MPESPPLRGVIIPVTPFQQNCSLVWCAETKRAAVVDPGGEVDRILAAAETHDVVIEKVLVTHGHLDHAGAVADLAEELAIPIEGPQQADAFWIERIAQQGARYGLGYCRRFVPDRWLGDGDTVTIGTHVLSVHHCPGHTPGHAVFYDAPSRLAFVGDVLFRGSIGRSDLPRGDRAALIRSIVGKLWPLGREVTFVPGHGPLSTFGQERLDNPFVADEVLGVSER
jgi:glyoxylase-like metal-dependent hydrolase (beta-lactamase superfamily II)